MKFKLEYIGNVNVEKVRVYTRKNNYESLYINLDGPLHTFVTDGNIITIEHIDVVTSYYYEKDDPHKFVHDMIEGLLCSTITNETLNDMIIYSQSYYYYTIKDLMDETVKKDLMEMIRKAMIEYQI